MDNNGQVLEYVGSVVPFVKGFSNEWVWKVGVHEIGKIVDGVDGWSVIVCGKLVRVVGEPYLAEEVLLVEVLGLKNGIESFIKSLGG